MFIRVTQKCITVLSVRIPARRRCDKMSNFKVRLFRFSRTYSVQYVFYDAVIKLFRSRNPLFNKLSKNEIRR